MNSQIAIECRKKAAVLATVPSSTFEQITAMLCQEFGSNEKAEIVEIVKQTLEAKNVNTPMSDGSIEAVELIQPNASVVSEPTETESIGWVYDEEDEEEAQPPEQLTEPIEANDAVKSWQKFLDKRGKSIDSQDIAPSESLEPQLLYLGDKPYLAALHPLIVSGDVVFDDESGHWTVRRCSVCGEFNRDVCCDKKARRESVGDRENTYLFSRGKQALGLEPIKKPEPPKPVEQTWAESTCWNQFRGVDELEGDGNISWVVQNILPTGIAFLTGLPKEGKSFVALSLAKAITSGEPWLGRIGYEVPQAMPVLWLAAESGDSGLKMRCMKFGITKDKSRFLARTLTQGVVDLDNSELEKLVRLVCPFIILETLIRFGNGEDEDDAGEASKLDGKMLRLRSWGAPGILALHHGRKDMKTGTITMGKSMRGSGEFSAVADAIWTLCKDDKLYRNGVGPNEIDLKGWGRDFQPYPVRLALTRKAPADQPDVTRFAPGLVSVIDQEHDLGWVDKHTPGTVVVVTDEILEGLVKENPNVSVKDLSDKTSLGPMVISRRLNNLGWTKGRGRSNKPWAKREMIQNEEKGQNR